MGEERAESYLRLLAEAQVRDVAGLGWRELVAREQRVRWAGGVLAAAGLVREEFVDRVAGELEAALALRAAGAAGRSPWRVAWLLDRATEEPAPRGAPLEEPALRGAPLEEPAPRGAPLEEPALRGAPVPMVVTPIGRGVVVANERAPGDLYLLTLVRTPERAAITVAMRMHWPADGSSADLELTGAGPQHLPYDRLEAVGDDGSRYLVSLAGDGGTAAWQGVAVLSGVPPAAGRWLDLVADRTRRLLRVDLSRAGPAGATVTGEALAVPGGERVLAREAERIMAGAWGAGADHRLDEMIEVLADAGGIAADSRVPGQLAALCRRLGVAGPGGDGELPQEWGSVLSQRREGDTAEVFAALGVGLPEVDGGRFVLAGLSSAAGHSQLHVVGSGPEGVSWWVRDGGGGWHVGMAGEPDPIGAGQGAFRVGLTPPLAGVPDTIEVVVTGQRGRVRAVVPVRGGELGG